MTTGTLLSTTPDTSPQFRNLWVTTVDARDDGDAAQREGGRLLGSETVSLALALSENISRTLAPQPSVTIEERATELPLSSRELDVLQLVAEGLTSKQIGKQLFLSPRTVNTHLTSIFNKLAVGSRAHAVAVAARGGFLWETGPQGSTY